MYAGVIPNMPGFNTRRDSWAYVSGDDHSFVHLLTPGESFWCSVVLQRAQVGFRKSHVASHDCLPDTITLDGTAAQSIDMYIAADRTWPAQVSPLGVNSSSSEARRVGQACVRTRRFR